MRCHAGRLGKDEAGFTLIEMIVALALLALISLAGLALVETVLTTRQRTQGRLDRLADLERAVTLIDGDLAQLTGGPIEAGALGLGFDRSAGRGTIGRVHIGYVRLAGSLQRIVDGRPQTLLDHVGAVRWSFLDGRGWRSSWPPAPARAAEWPRAIAVEIALTPEPDRPTGMIRRVVPLPAHP